MDINRFLEALLPLLADINFVEKIDLHTEVFILKGKVILKNDRFLQVYLNERTGTLAFALIESDRRLWGIDCDSIRGWHVHPVVDAESHREISPKTIAEIISTFLEAWKNVVWIAGTECLQ